MSILEKEADRLRSALTETPLGSAFDEIYSAQQALAWASDPQNVTSPMDMIQQFNTHASSGDCPS
jgi:hypothetical protein